ncbi:hypothetical protein MSG28_009875 [Choristoneura fumiferana]|uniref:Uncharacterized protein n=1 Tax=Choristoneura fumiferana TaxID=7141 RepID=A0ACC0JD17_CHOFU|nr:hypothetical protein MSG28_009875 [Choristoneura fumiferana]
MILDKDMATLPYDKVGWQDVVFRKDNVWLPAKIVDIHSSPRSYIIKDEYGTILRRNSSQLKPSFVNSNQPRQITIPQEIELSQLNQSIVPQEVEFSQHCNTNIGQHDQPEQSLDNCDDSQGRPRRVARPPSYLRDYVTDLSEREDKLPIAFNKSEASTIHTDSRYSSATHRHAARARKAQDLNCLRSCRINTSAGAQHTYIPINYNLLHQDELVYEVQIRGDEPGKNLNDLRKQIHELARDVPADEIEEFSGDISAELDILSLLSPYLLPPDACHPEQEADLKTHLVLSDQLNRYLTKMDSMFNTFKSGSVTRPDSEPYGLEDVVHVGRAVSIQDDAMTYLRHAQIDRLRVATLRLWPERFAYIFRRSVAVCHSGREYSYTCFVATRCGMGILELNLTAEELKDLDEIEESQEHNICNILVPSATPSSPGEPSQDIISKPGSPLLLD